MIWISFFKKFDALTDRGSRESRMRTKKYLIVEVIPAAAGAIKL